MLATNLHRKAFVGNGRALRRRNIEIIDVTPR